MTSGEQVRSVQRWMLLDLWMALGMESREFDRWLDSGNWDTMWSECLAGVRTLAHGRELAASETRRAVRALAEETGAEVTTGASGLNQCRADCMWAGPGNQVVAGVHRHPFAAVMGERKWAT